MFLFFVALFEKKICVHNGDPSKCNEFKNSNPGLSLTIINEGKLSSEIPIYSTKFAVYVSGSINAELDLGVNNMNVEVYGITVGASIKIKFGQSFKYELNNINVIVNNLNIPITIKELVMKGSKLIGPTTSSIVNVSPIKLVSDGNSLKGLLNIEVPSFELTEIPTDLKENIEVQVSGFLSSLGTTVVRAQNVARKVLFGIKSLYIASNVTGSKGIVIRSKSKPSIEIENSNELFFGRIGNPKPNQLLDIKLFMNGGVLYIANQTWVKASGSMINIVQKAASTVLLSGRYVPVSITNDCSEKLSIIAQELLCGIQGKIVFKTLNDEIITKLGIGELEFTAKSIEHTISAAKAKIDQLIDLSLDDTSFFSFIPSGIKNLITSVTASIQKMSLNDLRLSSGSMLSIGLEAASEIKAGFIDVLQDFKMPKFGNAKLKIDSVFGSSVNFSSFKDIISNPINIFCTKSELHCDKWDFLVDDSLKSAGAEKQCVTVGDKKCIQLKINKLPSWIPEEYCLGGSGCSKNSVPINWESLPVLAQKIHSKSQSLLLFVKDSMSLGTKIDFSDYNVNTSIKMSSSGSVFPAVQLVLNSKTKDHVASLSLDGLTLNFSLLVNQKSLLVDIADITFKDVHFYNALNNVHVSFTNNNVTMDTNTFRRIATATFKNLALNFADSETVDKIILNPREWGLQIAGKAIEKISTVNVSGSFSASFPSNGLNLDIEAGATSTRGFFFNIKGNAGTTIPVTFSTNWNTINNYGDGIGFQADCNLNISGLPHDAEIKLKGKGSYVLTPKGESVNIAGVTEINVSKYFQVLGNKNVTFDKLLFGQQATISVKDAINAITPIVTRFAEAYPGSVSNLNGKFNVGESLVLGAGANLNTGIITFGAEHSSSAMLLSNNPRISSSLSSLELGYKFSENGIPVLSIDNGAGSSPDQIIIEYIPTPSNPEIVEFNEWVEQPLTMITGKFNCDEWSQKVIFKSTYTDLNGNTSKLSVICDKFADERQDTVSMQLVLTSQPDMSKVESSGTDNSGSSDTKTKNGSAGTIIVIALVILVSVLAVFAYQKYKPKEEKEMVEGALV